MATTKTENIAESLKLLEEAATQKKDELQNLVSNKYTHLKTALADAAHSAAETLSASTKPQIDALIHAKEVSTEKAAETATVVNDHVHANPWPYIGGTAAVALLAGYFLGRQE